MTTDCLTNLALIVAQHYSGLELICESADLVCAKHALHEREDSLRRSGRARLRKRNPCCLSPRWEAWVVVPPPEEESIRVVVDAGTVECGSDRRSVPAGGEPQCARRRA